MEARRGKNIYDHFIPSSKYKSTCCRMKTKSRGFSFVWFYSFPVLPCHSQVLSSPCAGKEQWMQKTLWGLQDHQASSRVSGAGRLAHTCSLWWYRSRSPLCMFALCDFRHKDGLWGYRKNLIFKILAGTEPKFPPVTIPWYMKFSFCSPEAFLSQQSSSPPLLSSRMKEFSVSHLKKISCWVTLYPSNAHIDDHIRCLLAAWIAVKERSGLLW